jgi:hypothetical protein
VPGYFCGVFKETPVCSEWDSNRFSGKEVIMKPKIFLLTAVLAVAASVALMGCGSKPTNELKMAKIAMDQARDAEASEYEPNDWDRARLQWEEAIGLIQIKRYGEARNVLIETIGSLNMARDKAKRRIESLKIEITALQASAEMELKNLEQAGENPKTTPYMRKRIDGALAHIEERIATMKADFDAKEYLRSRMVGQEVLRYIHELQKG